MPNAPSDYEGRQEQVRDWELPAIETFRNIYADRDYRVTLSMPEFTCVCPKTGLPDFATLTLEYVPDHLCLELKSLKEYLLAYRKRGIFHENVVNRVLDDVTKLDPDDRLHLFERCLAVVGSDRKIARQELRFLSELRHSCGVGLLRYQRLIYRQFPLWRRVFPLFGGLLIIGFFIICHSSSFRQLLSGLAAPKNNYG